MAFRWSVFAAAMLLSGMVCALCAGYVLRRPGAVGRTGLAVVLAAAAVWGLAYGVELGVLTRSAKEFWGTAKYVGVRAAAGLAGLRPAVHRPGTARHRPAARGPGD